MLSISAVNAFLKVLEEPPKNVIFILATTDPQKLPITVLSRCQRFDFKRIDVTDIFNRLKYICEHEKIKIDNKSLKLISIVADGAMRDAISI
ncbi:ATPase associated with various cellular activities family protein (plasmid) [Clostridium botulinum]|nr:ATPase associated with various cellular activities family protein [Clostridium botulinum]